MKSEYEDFLGKKVQITTGFYASTIGVLEERDRDRFDYKVFANPGWVVVGLEDVMFLTPEKPETKIVTIQHDSSDLPFTDLPEDEIDIL